MARTSRKELSHKEVSKRLEEIASTTTADDLVFDLLRIFAQTTDTTIARIKEGKKPAVKEEGMILVEKLIAYKSSTPEQLFDDLEALKANDKARKKAARLLVVSDGRKIMGFDPKEDETYENEIALLWKDYDFFMPLAGIEKFRNIEENEADVKASYLMAKIYDDIRRYNDLTGDEQIHSLNVFLTRLLFCFFAEDTGIFEETLFTGSVDNYTQTDGSDLKDYIESAFDIMSIESPVIRDNMPRHIRQFPYVNGGLFREHHPVPNLSRRTRDLILRCGKFQWENINPDIFGSMIQAVIRPEDRAGLGLHYTSVPNILKVIRPLFLDALYEVFAECKDDEKKLRQMLVRLSKIKFFDPACGSGNFLIIAYKELRKLETQIWMRITELNKQGVLPLSSIALTQFYGIEIDEFAQETATLSLWLAEHQENKKFYDKFGSRPGALPLRASGHIVHGNACRLDWNTVCPHTAEEEVYVMGNPPYLGSSMQNESQKADLTYVCCGFANYKNLDYIACWFILGARYIKDTKAKYAFVSTNSICQGDSVALLWDYVFQQNAEIFFAHRSFKWNNNAKYNAAVICVIIGLCASRDGLTKYLFDKGNKIKANNINAYLLDAANITIGRLNRSISGFPEMVFGNKPSDGGFLILQKYEAEDLLNRYPQSKEIIRAYQGADSYINGHSRYCLWIADDKVDFAKQIPEVAKRIEQVQKFRLNSPADSTVEYAAYPHRFRQRAHVDGASLIVPRVSSERRDYIPIGFLDENTIISDSAQVVYGADIFICGILCSRIHVLWVATVGGKLKTDYRYSSLCYNSFPFPKITAEQRRELEEYAEEVILTREGHSEMTLAEMYDPDGMPQDLREAHRALDLAVERCYRPEPFRSDEERLEHLFKLYEKMTRK